MGNIKAIETVYKGYRFRSRLEARWAVFFDTLGVKWAYEPEGYDLGDAGWYLPDFWIDWGTDDGFWIEVKAHKNLSEREFSVADKLSEFAPGYVVFGQPGLPEYKGNYLPTSGNWKTEDYRGDGWHISFAKIKSSSLTAPGHMYSFKTESMRRFFCWHEYMSDGNGTGEYRLWPVPAFEIANTQDQRGVFSRLQEGYVVMDDFIKANPLFSGRKSIDSKNLTAAYTAARSARFEHDERKATT